MTKKKIAGYTLLSLLISGMLSVGIIVVGWKYMWLAFLSLAAAAVIIALFIFILWLIRDQ